MEIGKYSARDGCFAAEFVSLLTHKLGNQYNAFSGSFAVLHL